jgi:hypothetical protein
MTYDEMRAALRDARDKLNVADNVADELAWMLEGRLNKCSSTNVLSKLKRELRDFNSHTGRWK